MRPPPALFPRDTSAAAASPPRVRRPSGGPARSAIVAHRQLFGGEKSLGDRFAHPGARPAASSAPPRHFRVRDLRIHHDVDPAALRRQPLVKPFGLTRRSRKAIERESAIHGHPADVARTSWPGSSRRAQGRLGPYSPDAFWPKRRFRLSLRPEVCLHSTNAPGPKAFAIPTACVHLPARPADRGARRSRYRLH